MIGLRAIAGSTKYLPLYLATTGAGLILFGMALLIWPELLAYLVSFFFIFLGAASLTVAWRIRQLERKVKRTVQHVTDTIEQTIEDLKDPFTNF